jgi:predicted outer membrane repeat protein
MRSVWPVVVCVALVACKQEEKPLPGDLSVDTESLDFGTVALGESSALDVTLSNAGGTAVNVLSVTLIDGDQDVFALSRAGDVVEAGASLPVTVTFTPEDEELYTGQVQIRTDDEELDNVLVVLRGIGGPSNADNDGDGVSIGEGDCDDYNDTVYPGAPEGCDGRDTNCDGSRPADEADDDGDGWLVCEDDCDDGNNLSYPGAAEICDGEDNDCDGSANENVDDDGDGFTICEGDCDDDEALSFPGNPEVCDDGVDNDCNTGIDDIDQDGDGHSVCSSTGDCNDLDATAYPIVVSTTGSSAGTGTDANPVDSLATALTMLDTTCRLVVLEAGTYSNVDVDWTGGTIEIAGRTGTASDVVLQAAQYSRHLTITGGNVTVRDLTLTGGDAAEDGGAINVANASLTLSNLRAEQNTSALDGGAVAVLSGNLELRRGCRFEDNTAGEDGGAIEVVAATLTDRGTTYRNNQAPAGRGGALSVNGGTVDVEGDEFRGNSASEGGGLALLNSGDYRIEDCAVSLNSATDGGGIALRDVSDNGGRIRNTTVQDNVASATGGGLAFLGYTGALAILNNTFTGNDATGEGAAIAVGVTTGSGIDVAANVIQDNDGPSAVYVVSGAGANVVYNTAFLQNSGVHFAGEIGDGGGAPLDPTNQVRNPQLRSVSDDGNPDNDDLTLQGGSPEIDDGPPDASYNDPDGSRNDRGFTGGPGAG